jgi:hypothetical protein
LRRSTSQPDAASSTDIRANIHDAVLKERTSTLKIKWHKSRIEKFRQPRIALNKRAINRTYNNRAHDTGIIETNISETSL